MSPGAICVDLSHTLDSTTSVYPGDPRFCCRPALTLESDGSNVAVLSMGSHTGTHVDAPYHFIEDGQRIDELPLSRFVGPALVVDVSGKGHSERIIWEDFVVAGIEVALKERGDSDGVILLVRTGWSKYWGTDAYFKHPFLDREVAERIIALGIRTISIDALSPDQTHTDPHGQGDFAVHKVVLGAGGVIAENLTNLEAIQEGKWTVSMVPLEIGGCDGSPVRAFAWR